MEKPYSNLKLAERGAVISILAYLLLSSAKLATGHLLHSSSLVADGFNNLPSKRSSAMKQLALIHLALVSEWFQPLLC